MCCPQISLCRQGLRQTEVGSMVRISKKEIPYHSTTPAGDCDFAGFQQTKKTSVITTRAYWRRGSESNRRIKVLQTSPLPLGYRAPDQYVSVPAGKSPSGGNEPVGNRNLERETGFEPATSTLARSHSTTELLPLVLSFYSTCAFRGNYCTRTALRALGTIPNSRCIAPEPRVPSRGRSASSCPCCCGATCAG